MERSSPSMATVNIDELTRMCSELAHDEGGTFLRPWAVTPEGLEAGPSRPDYRAQIVPAGSGPEAADALSTPSRWGGLGESKEAAMIDLLRRNKKWPAV